jgi:hypothetical protein
MPLWRPASPRDESVRLVDVSPAKLGKCSRSGCLYSSGADEPAIFSNRAFCHFEPVRLASLAQGKLCSREWSGWGSRDIDGKTED